MRTSTAVILTEFGKPFVLLIATLELAERVYKSIPVRFQI